MRKALSLIPRFFMWALLLVAFFLQTTTAQQQQPNVIWIFVDDLGLGDISSFGHPYAITPNLDRLAAEGTSFYNFHNTGNVCPTSRAGFMTSRNPSWFPNYSEEYGFMGTETVTRLMQKGGYHVGHVGKWNIGPTPEGDSYEPYGIDDLRLARARSGDVRGREGLRFDEAIDFVTQNQNIPFYLNVWATAPHTPINPIENLVEHFYNVTVDKNDFGFHMQNKLFRLETSGVDITDNMRRYLGIVYGLDLNVGRLLDKLDQLNIAQDTIVVFTSDNGPAFSQTGSSGDLRGNKHDFYQGGFVTPFLVRWPGKVPAGKINRESVFSGLDWLPTVCSLTGVEYNSSIVEGEDVSDIWLGSDRSRENPIFFRDLQRRATVTMRAGKWKLLDWVKELYNLEDDPEERFNIYDDHPDIVAEMLTTIAEWEATLPDVHARLPDKAYPFDPTSEADVIATPFALLDEVPSPEPTTANPTPSPTTGPTASPTSAPFDTRTTTEPTAGSTAGTSTTTTEPTVAVTNSPTSTPPQQTEMPVADFSFGKATGFPTPDRNPSVDTFNDSNDPLEIVSSASPFLQGMLLCTVTLLLLLV